MSDKKQFLDSEGVKTFAKEFLEKVNELIDGHIIPYNEKDSKGENEDE